MIDFDISKDQNFLVYSLKETGFEGNSDIYFKNLTGGQTIRLTEKNDISSFSPRIFPDNSKVAYVERVYNPTTKTLSDGEIWLINSDGNAKSSKKLFVSDKIEGLETEQYCASDEKKKSVKIGIEEISPDGNVMSYWKKQWAPECSGFWKMPYFSKLDGNNFLTEKFKQQNTFNFDIQVGNQKIFNWEVNKIFWLADGSFIVGQRAPIPIEGESIYYFDKDQNKKVGII